MKTESTFGWPRRFEVLDILWSEEGVSALGVMVQEKAAVVLETLVKALVMAVMLGTLAMASGLGKECRPDKSHGTRLSNIAASRHHRFPQYTWPIVCCDSCSRFVHLRK